MTSNMPYTETYDFSHMYNSQDLRTPNTGIKVRKNSLLEFFQQNEFTKYNYILQISRLENMFNNTQANITVFAAKDNDIKLPIEVIMNMDILTARNIILFGILDNKIDYNILSQSPIKYVYTRNNRCKKLLVETYNDQTFLNGRDIKIVKKDITLDNGIVHIITDLVIPYYL